MDFSKFSHSGNIKTVSFDLVEQLNTFLADGGGEDSLLIMHLNIRSLNRNYDELVILVETLKVKPHLIVLTETWQMASESPFHIPGYNFYYNGATFNQNDGTVVYVRHEISYGVETRLLNQVTFSRFTFQFKCTKYGLTALYRPPSCNKETFIHDLHDILHECDRTVEIFAGDINIDILDSSVQLHTDYLNVLAQFGFNRHLSGVTHPTGNGGSCIDHIFLKDNRTTTATDDVTSLILKYCITNHYPTFLSIKNVKLPKIGKEHIVKTYLNENKLLNIFSKQSWLSMISDNNINDCAEKFVQTVKKNIEAATTTKKAKQYTKLKPWITDSIITSIITRNKIASLVRKYPQNAKIKSDFKSYRNILSKLINATKKSYYSNKVNSCANNPKKVWGLINEMSGKVIKKNEYNIKDENGRILCDNEAKADFLCDFFTSVPKLLANKIKRSNISYINKNPIVDSMFLLPTTPNEINAIIQSLKTSSAPGLDCIPVKVLKLIKDYIAHPLSHLTNLCFTTGLFPDIFKKAIIVPIYKSGDHADPNNYRPISLISNVAKIIEKCMKSRLLKFLEKK